MSGQAVDDAVRLVKDQEETRDFRRRQLWVQAAAGAMPVVYDQLKHRNPDRHDVARMAGGIADALMAELNARNP